MAVSTVIGTTKKTYTVWHFGIKCDIMHTFMRTLKKKFISPIDLAVFFETFLPQAAVMFCETDPFFLTLQPCSRDFLTPVNTGFKKNVSF